MLSLRNSVLFACLLLSVAALGQGDPARPNFSGIWRLDPSSSQFGSVTPPVSAQYIIRHLHSTLAFDYTQDASTSRIEITPDNEERMTDEVGEMQTWTRAYWEGRELVLESRQRYLRPEEGPPPVRWISRWRLSPDRKVLTIERRISAPRGPVDQILVFRRQPLVTPPGGRSGQ